MNSITKLTVPDGISFISEWAAMANGFQIPQGHCIINKILPGCGFTQYCITNNLPTILCSPRVVLLENKLAQNPGCFYVKSKTDNEKNKIKKKYNLDKEEDLHKFLFSQFKTELLTYLENDCLKPKVAPKILVTYDSLGKLVLALRSVLFDINRKYGASIIDFSTFSVIVDEFHLIFNDAAFKAEVELNFLSYLEKFSNVCYVSATPILAEYLDQMDEFSTLNYYELDWGPRAIQPNLIMQETSNIEQVARNIIEGYKSGVFNKRTIQEKDEFGNVIGDKIIESREVVFYVNSVKTITNVVKTCNLQPDEVNIICSQATSDNRKKIKKCGKGFDFGSVPLQNQPHKMFTFCTSTAYCGVDFYSTCARTVVLSDGDFYSMAVDISLDLPQILGRQRLDCNPWRYEAEFYYKTCFGTISQQEFDNNCKQKIEKTNILINVFNQQNENIVKSTLLENYKSATESSRYKLNYVGVKELPSGEFIPVINKLVLLSEKRAFELQSRIYKSIFYVRSACNNQGFQIQQKTPSIIDYSEFNSIQQYEDRLKYCCDKIKELSPEQKEKFLSGLSPKYSEPIEKLGMEFIEGVWYKYYDISERLKYINSFSIRKKLIQEKFQIGEKYLSKDIKQVLQEIYDSLGFKRKKAKATDLGEYFEIEFIQLLNPETNKRVTGYKIISLK